MKIMYMVFHPDISKSTVNASWMDIIKNSGKATYVRDMYSECKNFQIDFETEKKLLLECDRIVFQFPFYWYSSPPLLKKWEDDVLLYDFAYGKKGDKLAGKDMQLFISTGGKNDYYQRGGKNNFTIEEFLLPFRQTACLCKMNYLPPVWMDDVFSRDKEEISDFGNKMVSIMVDENIKPVPEPTS